MYTIAYLAVGTRTCLYATASSLGPFKTWDEAVKGMQDYCTHDLHPMEDYVTFTIRKTDEDRVFYIQYALINGKVTHIVSQWDNEPAIPENCTGCPGCADQYPF